MTLSARVSYRLRAGIFRIFSTHVNDTVEIGLTSNRACCHIASKGFGAEDLCCPYMLNKSSTTRTDVDVREPTIDDLRSASKMEAIDTVHPISFQWTAVTRPNVRD